MSLKFFFSRKSSFIYWSFTCFTRPSCSSCIFLPFSLSKLLKHRRWASRSRCTTSAKCIILWSSLRGIVCACAIRSGLRLPPLLPCIGSTCSPGYIITCISVLSSTRSSSRAMSWPAHWPIVVLSTVSRETAVSASAAFWPQESRVKSHLLASEPIVWYASLTCWNFCTASFESGLTSGCHFFESCHKWISAHHSTRLRSRSHLIELSLDILLRGTLCYLQGLIVVFSFRGSMYSCSSASATDVRGGPYPIGRDIQSDHLQRRSTLHPLQRYHVGLKRSTCSSLPVQTATKTWIEWK